MSENDLRQWFGNRGVKLEEKKLTYKVVKKQSEHWAFIIDNCFEYEGNNEVELYALDTMHCECYNGWKAQSFKWNLENMLSLIIT